MHHGVTYHLLLQVMGFQIESAEAICRVYHVVSKWWRPNFDSCIVGHLLRYSDFLERQ